MPDLPQSSTDSSLSLPQPATTATSSPISADSPLKNLSSNHTDLAMTPVKDPLTSNIIHDTNDKVLVKTMTRLADAGADASTTVEAAAVSSSNLPASSSSTTSTSVAPLNGTLESQQPIPVNLSSTERPILQTPQAQSPITLHHALDAPLPPTPISLKVLPRSIETSVKDTLAKHSEHPSDRAPHQGPGSIGQRRIMTPTSRLAETAVGVREVSKKIGRARVKWETPRTVMIVTKPGDESLLKITKQISLWMISSREIIVFVDEKLKDVPKFKYPSFLKSTKLGYDYTKSLKFWTADLCAQDAHLFDFVITLGGDGTVLFTSWLFQKIVPPVLPFSAGSLGFLTPFPTGDYQDILSTCLDHGVRVNLRMRFSCTIYRCLEHRTVETTKKKKRKGHRRRAKSGFPDQNSPQQDSEDDDSDRRDALPTVLTAPTETFEILNDLVLDRGPSANLSLLELFGDDQHLTTVQADGIVISTPTGSTAYSLAAGGPLTHPEIPAILISPICPHTLSFRPMLLPDSMELRICVPFDSRSTAWASFDGRGRVELRQGDHIKVTSSVYPLPTICSSTQSSDWFHSLSRCLRWNERERQKGFTVVEHSRPKRTRQPSSSQSPPGSKPASTAVEGGGGTSVSQNTQGNQNPDNSSGSGTSHNSQRRHNHSQTSGQNNTQDSQHMSGNSSATSSRSRQHNSKSGPGSPMARKGNGTNNDYFDHSPQDTDTMLTCWGTDSSDTDDDDDDDDEDSDSKNSENDASDGDGEWEESSDSDDDDDYAAQPTNAQGGSESYKDVESQKDRENASTPTPTPTPKLAAGIPINPAEAQLSNIDDLTNKMSQPLLGSSTHASDASDIESIPKKNKGKNVAR
ncbi:hypothetical protein BGX27_007713 [Mortierella sp. AM989]|nr:hypothetical protein BGX27_007713 [Mortierella sp. AM989]